MGIERYDQIMEHLEREGLSDEQLAARLQAGVSRDQLPELMLLSNKRLEIIHSYLTEKELLQVKRLEAEYLLSYARNVPPPNDIPPPDDEV